MARPGEVLSHAEYLRRTDQLRRLEAVRRDDGDCILAGVPLSSLSLALWAEVYYKELDRRKLVRLHSGSYDDHMNARIQRCWERVGPIPEFVRRGRVTSAL